MRALVFLGEVDSREEETRDKEILNAFVDGTILNYINSHM